MFFKSFLGHKEYLGIDIGTASIKVAELSQVSGQRVAFRNYGILETYGYLERFNDALQTSTLKPVEAEISAYLKLVLNHSRIKSRDVVASLPAFSAFTTLIELPAMSEPELQRAMAFQAKQYIPLPLASVRLDWFKVGERLDENGVTRQQIFLISMPNEQIERYQRIFKNAGLNLMALEIETMSLARVLTADFVKPALLADIGARSTAFAVAKNGFLKFSAQTDFAGASLTESVSSGLGIAPRRAEELKKQNGLLGGGGGQELSTLILPYLDVIINEAGRARENFEKSYSEKVASVILSGGGANLLGIEDYISRQMNLPVVKANPFEWLSYPRDLEPLVKELGPAISAAVGLGLRAISR